MKKSALIVFVGILTITLLLSSAWVMAPDTIQTKVKEWAGLTNARPIAIMVENSFAARPQSGLQNADVVFEVVDEYGITRFVAIFGTKDASIVGPFRSS